MVGLSFYSTSGWHKREWINDRRGDADWLWPGGRRAQGRGLAAALSCRPFGEIASPLASSDSAIPHGDGAPFLRAAKASPPIGAAENVALAKYPNVGSRRRGKWLPPRTRLSVRSFSRAPAPLLGPFGPERKFWGNENHADAVLVEGNWRDGVHESCRG